MTKILFMGTPDFSATVLKGLISDERYEILAVVTQPDRAVGRKKEIRMTPGVRRFISFGGRWDRHSSLWTILAESFVRGDEVCCQRACFPSSKIPWWSSYPLCHHEWG